MSSHGALLAFLIVVAVITSAQSCDESDSSQLLAQECCMDCRNDILAMPVSADEVLAAESVSGILEIPKDAFSQYWRMTHKRNTRTMIPAHDVKAELTPEQVRSFLVGCASYNSAMLLAVDPTQNEDFSGTGLEIGRLTIEWPKGTITLQILYEGFSLGGQPRRLHCAFMSSFVAEVFEDVVEQTCDYTIPRDLKDRLSGQAAVRQGIASYDRWRHRDGEHNHRR